MIWGWTQVTGQCTCHSRGLELGTLELPSHDLSSNPPHTAIQLKHFNRLFRSFPIWFCPAIPDGCLTVPHHCTHITVLPSLNPYPSNHITACPYLCSQHCTPIIAFPSLYPIPIAHHCTPITAPPSPHPIPTTSSSHHHHLCPSVWVPSRQPHHFTPITMPITALNCIQSFC